MIATNRNATNGTSTDATAADARAADATAADARAGDGPAADAATRTAPPPLTAEVAAGRIARLFPEVYRLYHFGRRVEGAELPVTRRGLEVLQHLALSGPLTVGEQAVHLGLRRNSVSELLQRLEAKGLVARIRDERDERRVLVWLTPAGADVVSRVGQVLAPDLLSRVMSGLSPSERAIVVRGFELLASPPPAASGAHPTGTPGGNAQPGTKPNQRSEEHEW